MFDLATLRVFLHVSAAAIWVGGQFSSTVVLPRVAELGPDAHARIAKAFALVGWPAYGIAVLTGLWSVMTIPLTEIPHPEIEIKVLVVLLSGLGAVLARLAGRNAAMVTLGNTTASLFGAASIWVGVVLPA